MFKDRQEAGRLLAKKIARSRIPHSILVGIPRGGLIVAATISSLCQIPLDVVVVKKITLPLNPELALGAVGSGNIAYWEGAARKTLQNKTYQLVLEREKAIRKIKKEIPIAGNTVLLVDDGVATGATVMCAQKILYKKKANKIILLTPVIGTDIYKKISQYFDEIIFLERPSSFKAVGQFYREFPQVSDEEVLTLLRQSENSKS